MKNSLVFQTRAGWGLVALLLAATLAASAIGMTKVQNVQTRLGDEAIPSLSRVEAMSEEIARLKQRLTQLSTAREKDALDLARSDARLSLSNMKQLATYDPEISSSLSVLDDQITEVGALSRTAATNKHEIRDLESVLGSVVSGMEIQVANLSSNTVAEIEALIHSEANGFDQVSLSVGISDLNLAAQIQSMFDRELDLQTSLTSVSTLVELGELEKRISFNLRAIVRSLALLSDRPERQPLAKSLRDMRQVVLGDDGYIHLKQKGIEIETSVHLKITKALREIDDISLFTNAGLNQARDGIRQAAAAIDGTVKRTISLLSGLTIAAVSLAILTAYFFVERRIVRRLILLTKAVRAIAAGDTKWKVMVSGGDEFGEMADALEIFKSNLTELRRSNDELERFAYAASHDLKSPLRAIHDLAEWTIEDAGDQLPEDCREHLTMLLRRAERLSGLLEDLLSYSRVGREEHSVGDIYPQAFAQEIADLLGSDGRFDVEVTGITEKVETYVAPLRQILLNLITNAVKHHDQATAAITVNFAVEDDRMRISVSDDGPGIDPKFHDRIFGLFQTLQSRDVVEGSGMGLAIILKQVENYDGYVKVVSDPSVQRGTTFIFDWPIFLDNGLKKLTA